MRAVVLQPDPPPCCVLVNAFQTIQAINRRAQAPALAEIPAEIPAQALESALAQLAMSAVAFGQASAAPDSSAASVAAGAPSHRVRR